MSLARRKKVAECLMENQGRWVSGVVLASAEVGGSEGLRRVRELRDEEWPIEKRKKPGSTAYEYRLSAKEEDW